MEARLVQVLSKVPKNVTAVQLPQIDIPVPQKPKIDLPTVPAVPMYQFEVPDIKSEIEDLGQTAVDKVKGLMTQVQSGFMSQERYILLWNTQTVLSGSECLGEDGNMPSHQSSSSRIPGPMSVRCQMHVAYQTMRS